MKFHLFRVPLVILTACLIVWLYQMSVVNSLDQRSAPLIAELNQMHSLRGQVGMGAEAFIRGLLGDAFGTANEASNRDKQIRDELRSIIGDYSSAKFWTVTSLLIGALSLGRITYLLYKIDRRS